MDRLAAVPGSLVEFQIYRTAGLVPGWGRCRASTKLRGTGPIDMHGGFGGSKKSPARVRGGLLTSRLLTGRALK